MKKFYLGVTLFFIINGQLRGSTLLESISTVESGNNDSAIGDGGAALGRYQIHPDFYTDAKAGVAKIYGSCPGYYESVTNKIWAGRIVESWFDRYCKGKSNEVKARRFNGGLQGEKLKATIGYWVKIQKELSK